MYFNSITQFRLTSLLFGTLPCNVIIISDQCNKTVEYYLVHTQHIFWYYNHIGTILNHLVHQIFIYQLIFGNSEHRSLFRHTNGINEYYNVSHYLYYYFERYKLLVHCIFDNFIYWNTSPNYPENLYNTLEISHILLFNH